MFISQIIPLVIKLNAIFVRSVNCSLLKAIWLKLHTLLEHNETMCHAQEP